MLRRLAGYPGCEFQIREALADVIGKDKSELFFDKVRSLARCSMLALHSPAFRQFLEYFFSEKDAAFFKSLGLNCIRIPFNYRHFEGAYHVPRSFFATHACFHR